MSAAILRYTLNERVNHWIAGLTYIYCLVTGLAFWSPYMFWLAAVVGGGAVARFWHPWVGLVFTASVFWMYKVWRGDMMTTNADRAWMKSIRFYIRNEDENLPPVGRFNYGQKLYFWLVFYCFRALDCGLWNPSRGVCAGCATWPWRYTWVPR